MFAVVPVAYPCRLRRLYFSLATQLVVPSPVVVLTTPLAVPELCKAGFCIRSRIRMRSSCCAASFVYWWNGWKRGARSTSDLGACDDQSTGVSSDRARAGAGLIMSSSAGNDVGSTNRPQRIVHSKALQRPSATSTVTSVSFSATHPTLRSDGQLRSVDLGALDAMITSDMSTLNLNQADLARHTDNWDAGINSDDEDEIPQDVSGSTSDGLFDLPTADPQAATQPFGLNSDPQPAVPHEGRSTLPD